jgi:UDP:flavonoid glycosyltransferase YjiC (YdhE family)
MNKILLVTHWTGGDVMPFVRLGTLLRREGFQVTLFSHCVYRDIAIASGLDFVAIDDTAEYHAMVRDLPKLNDPVGDAAGTIEFHKIHHGPERLARECRLILAKIEDRSTAILFRHRSSIAGLLAAELAQAPVGVVFLAPNYLSHLELHESLVGAAIRDQINIARAEIGLAPIESWTNWMVSPRCKLGIWPQWYQQADEPSLPGLTAMGFLHENQAPETELAEDLRDFINRHAAPVLITGGTSRLISPRFYNTAVSACIQARRPAVVVLPFPDMLSIDLPDFIFPVRSASIPAILERASAIIHHGGIGTASEALLAAVPQIILPHMADRPDNAARFRALGIAKVYPELRWDPILIAQGLAETQNSEFQNWCEQRAKQERSQKSASMVIECLHALRQGPGLDSYSLQQKPHNSANPARHGQNNEPAISEEKRRILLELIKNRT